MAYNTRLQSALHTLQVVFNVITILSFSTAIFRSGIYIPASYKVNLLGERDGNPEVDGFIETQLYDKDSYFWTMGNCTDSHCDLHSMISAYIGANRSSLLKFIQDDDKTAELIVKYKHPWFFYDTVNDLISGIIQYLGAPNGIFLNTEACIKTKNIKDFKHMTKKLICSKISLTKLARHKNSSLFFTHQFPSTIGKMKYKFNNQGLPTFERILDSTSHRRRSIHNDIFFKSFNKVRSVIWYRKTINAASQIDALRGIIMEGLSVFPDQLQPTEELVASVSRYSYVYPPSNSKYNYTFIARSNSDESNLFGDVLAVDGIIVGGPYNQTSQFEIGTRTQHPKVIINELKLRWFCQIYIFGSILLYIVMISRRSITNNPNAGRLYKIHDWLRECDFGGLLANDIFLSFSLCYTVWYYGYSSAVRWCNKYNPLSANIEHDIYVQLTYETLVNMLSENGRGTFNMLLIFQLFFILVRNYLPHCINRKLTLEAKKQLEEHNYIAGGPMLNTRDFMPFLKEKYKLTLVLRLRYRVYGMIVGLYTFLVIMGLDQIAERTKAVQYSDQEWLFALDVLTGTKFQPSVLTFLLIWLIALTFPTYIFIFEVLPQPTVLFEKYRVFSISSLILESKWGLNIYSFPAMLEIAIRTYWFGQIEYISLWTPKQKCTKFTENKIQPLIQQQINYG